MLEIRNLNKRLKSFTLNNISLFVKQGEYHVLLGPSGSGKTLLLNIIAGFIKQDSGEILYNSIEISKFSPGNRKISYLLQDLALFPHLTVYENVAFPLKIKKIDKKQIDEKVLKYLEFTEILNLRDRSINKLSGGEKQRVALARNLITETKLLLLDEPFSAIDSQLKLSLKKLLKKISETGITIIHVTHNIEETYNLADKISVIENGYIIQSDKLENIVEKPKNKFIASFSGYKNFFYCQKDKTNDNFITISDISNGNKSLKIETESDYTNQQFVIIESNNINLSKQRPQNIQKNVFEGEIISIFREETGYEIEVDTGLIFWVKMTNKDFLDLNYKTGDRIIMYIHPKTIKIY